MRKIKLLISSLIPIVFVGIMNCFFIAMNSYTGFEFIKWRVIIIEFFITYLIGFIIFGFLPKYKHVIVTMGILVFILSVLNQFKYYYTGSPVYLSDLGHLDSME